MRPENFEIFTVSKVSGRKLSYANARVRACLTRARALAEKGSPTSLWGEKRPWGALATVSTTVKHNGEPHRGTTREPPWQTKKKSIKPKRKQNKRSQFILKLKSFILNNIFQQSLSRHSVDHFKIIAMIFGHMFPMSFFEKNVAKQRFLSVKSFYHRF